MKNVLMSFILTFILVTTLVNAETLTLDKNECVYHPEVNKDYCKTEYYLFDTGFNINKLSLKYADLTENSEFKISDGSFYVELPGINTEYKIEETGELGNYKIEVEGWKSPLLDIDNVVCYDGNCHYEFALWNNTYNYRMPIYGNLTTLTSTTAGLIPLNVTLNSSLELLWCGFDVNETYGLIGYIYYNSQFDYICVELDETNATVTIIDQGNGTNYKVGLNANLVAFYTCNDTTIYDVGIHGFNAINDVGIDLTTGLNGDNAIHFNGSGSVAELPIPATNFSTEFSFFGWFKRDGDVASVPLNYYDSATDFSRIIEVDNNNNWLVFVNKPDNTVRINAHSSAFDIDSGWFFYGVTINTSAANGIEFYINGTKDASKTVTTWNSPVLNGFASNIYFGAYGDGSGDYNGSVNNLRFFNYIPTTDEIKLMYMSEFEFYLNGSIEINITPPTPPANITLNIEKLYCYNSDYLYHSEKNKLENGSIEFVEYLTLCMDGCNNETWINLGRPGCNESDVMVFLIIVVIVVILIIVAGKWL